ncbi:hypothetical protein BABINDRAFT_162218 [Babjeviella inositovora NRRL Y-12698]|uniref:Zn(2)-C6 fungal-type domain-containing protein n=1 Tax=Babjeviella inositovora NRRL Y-12698 TaxID=984486 RepID=A0A1E3QN83_9ASCO|nr:uncharacterized protein BABINDRAFT_162218 [Babjeviella inositovora NRRL Y-12698]ODQ79166.1 hypothetical protein BABINDRAFT_162218 [Babjeviella inositovora NRRL Y-12698]
MHTPAEGASPAVKSETTTIPTRYKRPRSSRACQVCHSRKVRCNVMDQMPCSNCVTFGCECLIPDAKKAKARSAELVNSPKPEEEYETPAPTPAPLAAVLHPKQGIQPVPVPPHTFAGPTTPKTPQTPKNMSLHSAAIETLQHPVDAVLNSPLLDPLELEILQLRGAFITPSKACCLEMFEAFFTYIHPILPIFNRTHFYKQFMDSYLTGNEEPTSRPMSLLLIHSLCVAGSRVVNKNSLMFTEFPNRDRDGISLDFYKRAKSLYDSSYETDPITVVRSLLLLSWFWDGPDDVSRNSFYWCRIAISLSLGFGFQRDVSHSATMENWEKKIWRKVWWCLFVRDRQVALAFGRPVAIDLDDCDVPMLVELDFDESDTIYKGELVRAPPFESGALEAKFFIELIKLSEITGIIIKQQYLVRASNLQANNKIPVIQHCDLVLSNWFNNLPSLLQFLPSNEAENTRRHEENPIASYVLLLLNVEYYSILCLVHRSNILRRSKGLPETHEGDPTKTDYPSQGIAYQAAYMTTVIAQAMLQYDQLKYCPSFICYTLFSASMIMSLTLRGDSTGDRLLDQSGEVTNIEALEHKRKALECLNILVDALRNIGHIWGFARLSVLIIEAILSTTNIAKKGNHKRSKTKTTATDHSKRVFSNNRSVTAIGNIMDRQSSGESFITSSYPALPLSAASLLKSSERRAQHENLFHPQMTLRPGYPGNGHEELRAEPPGQSQLHSRTPSLVQPPQLPSQAPLVSHLNGERSMSPVNDTFKFQVDDFPDIHLLINEMPPVTLFMPSSLFPAFDFFLTGDMNGEENGGPGNSSMDGLTPILTNGSYASSEMMGTSNGATAEWDSLSFGGFGGLFGMPLAMRVEGRTRGTPPLGSRPESPANWMNFLNS